MSIFDVLVWCLLTYVFSFPGLKTTITPFFQNPLPLPRSNASPHPNIFIYYFTLSETKGFCEATHHRFAVSFLTSLQIFPSKGTLFHVFFCLFLHVLGLPLFIVFWVWVGGGGFHLSGHFFTPGGSVRRVWSSSPILLFLSVLLYFLR